MILDGGSDDVQIQREPAQTDDRNEEDIECREILDKSQARKIRPEKLSKTKRVIVTGAMIKEYQQKSQTDGVSYGPENWGDHPEDCCCVASSQVCDCQPAENWTFGTFPE